MSIKVISGNTKIKQVTVGSPVRIVRRIQASDFEFGNIKGIDLTGVTDGATLIYNSSTGNFESKVEITNTNTTFNGGNF